MSGSPEPNSERFRRREYSFGDFTLDLEHRLLRRGTEELPLRPKSFDVLACLVERHGYLVTSADLMEAVWPETAVTDNSLTQCMAEIRRVLNDDSQQLIRTVARRGYLFAIPVTTPVVELPAPTAAEGVHGPVRVAAVSVPSRRGLTSAVRFVPAIVGAALLGFLTWRMWHLPDNMEPLRATPLNSLPGVQRFPSFSPDGNYLVFTWTGPAQDNQDIYVQQIGSGSPLQRTTDPAIDYNPVWSPDGRWIAFLRRRWETGTSELRLISPLGGPEHKLTEIRISDTYFIIPPYLGWCPDSNCLVVTNSPEDGTPADLFVVSRDTGEKTQLTHPQAPSIGDTNPAISPDGDLLVFRRQHNFQTSDLYELRLKRGSSLEASGEPRRLIGAVPDAAYPTWMPHSDEILFSARGNLWRLAVPGSTPATRLPFAGEDGIIPAVSRFESGRARLMYVRSFLDTNIWRIEFTAPGATASAPPVLAISSTRRDSTPQLSPDGRRVVFPSDRSGRWEIWLADSDGSHPVQLTFMGPDSGAPCWSPDGKRIVFQSNSEGQVEVHAIPATGGKPQNLTSHPASDWRPSFSRDGQWIYFTSNRTGQHQIWKIPASGGDAIPVTNNRAFAAFESLDGSYLYYNDSMETPSPLWRQPVSGGARVKILDGVVRGAFTVLERGIYYIDRPSGAGGLIDTDQPSGETRLRYFDFASQRTTTVARNLGNVYLGLTASKDGRTVFYSRVDSSVDELMLVENFR